MRALRDALPHSQATTTRWSLPPLKDRYLESTVRMMMRDKENVDAAMAGFISTLEEDKDNVPAMLGMSTAFVLEDSVNKVRGKGRMWAWRDWTSTCYRLARHDLSIACTLPEWCPFRAVSSAPLGTVAFLLFFLRPIRARLSCSCRRADMSNNALCVISSRFVSRSIDREVHDHLSFLDPQIVIPNHDRISQHQRMSSHPLIQDEVHAFRGSHDPSSFRPKDADCSSAPGLCVTHAVGP